MSKYIEVIVIVEGKTEEIFIKRVLSKYLADRNIYMTPIQISKPGQKGGDVRFSRAIKDISLHMKQRPDTYISLFFDYYGVKEWPGLESARKEQVPKNIAQTINDATHQAVNQELSEYRSVTRFVPHVAVHEFESLLFSDPAKLAQALRVEITAVKSILDQFDDPEKINDSQETAPSKRLEKLYSRYKKTNTGIVIAQEIGIELMRRKCQVFNSWIERLEQLVETKKQNSKEHME
jgi:hypothetical protein